MPFDRIFGFRCWTCGRWRFGGSNKQTDAALILSLHFLVFKATHFLLTLDLLAHTMVFTYHTLNLERKLRARECAALNQTELRSVEREKEGKKGSSLNYIGPMTHQTKS